MKFASGIFGMILAMILSGPIASAQAPTTETKASTNDAKQATSDTRPGPLSTQTFYLTNVYQASDAIELTTALRNLLDPHDKIYLVPSQNAIFVQGSADQIALARRLLNDLDRPRKSYRLTYTVAEVDGGKRLGVQHFNMVVVTGQRTVVKQGSKVPIATGSSGSGSDKQTQFTYLDIGINFDATLDEFVNGVRLRTKVEQSSIAEEKSGLDPQEPIIRQAFLEGTSFLTPGKPLMLGSLDIVGSARRLDVEVVMEQVVQ